MSPIFNLFTAGLACTFAVATAYTPAKSGPPEGNPISKPGLNSVVPAGQSYSVTWQPTTQGTVSLVLLKGPSENAVPQYAIAEKIPNNGVFAWTPSTDLAPSKDATGYGIQLIDDATGQYQYTTQFGISNPDYSSSSSASSWTTSAPSASWSGAPHGHGGAHSGTWSESWTESATDSWTTSVSSTSAQTSSKVSSNSTAPVVTAPIATGTGISVPKNSTTAPVGTSGVASGQTTIPTATATSASATRSSSTAAPTQSNAAASMATSFAGLVFAGAVAVFAL